MSNCFVIGPIGDKFALLGSAERERYEESIQVFENVIAPACDEHNLEAVRADQIAVSGEITEQVFRHLYEDEVVIADVSGGNPNVMYELGLRHTRDLLTIQIGEYGQLPFDLEAVRTIKFSRSERGLIDARKQLSRALAVGLAEGGDPVTATRIWMRQQQAMQPSTQEATENAVVHISTESMGEIDEVDADGLLERMASVEDTMPQLAGVVESIENVLTGLGAKAEEMTREMNFLNSSGGPASARLAAANRFSRLLQEPADELTQYTNEFVRNMDDIDGSVNGILEYLSLNPDAREQEDTQQFLLSLINLARVSRQGMEDLSQFAGIAENLGSLSKSLGRPGRQMAQSVRTMAKAAALMDEWESAAARLLSRASPARANSAGDDHSTQQ